MNARLPTYRSLAGWGYTAIKLPHYSLTAYIPTHGVKADIRGWSTVSLYNLKPSVLLLQQVVLFASVSFVSRSLPLPPAVAFVTIFRNNAMPVSHSRADGTQLAGETPSEAKKFTASAKRIQTAVCLGVVRGEIVGRPGRKWSRPFWQSEGSRTSSVPRDENSPQPVAKHTHTHTHTGCPTPYRP